MAGWFATAMLLTATLAAGPQPAADAPRTALPDFAGSVERLDPATRTLMTDSSWRPECPVRLRELRLLHVRYVGFDRAAHDGELVVHRDVARPVLRAFRSMYESRFPIRRIRLVDHYGAKDMRSMKADNTSGFNCRRLPGSSTWSQHAYGLAIDLNPLENPYWHGGTVEPPAGRRYLDRSQHARGMIRPGGRAVAAFRGIGWGWGGYWTSAKDWQHFSANGR